MQKPTDVECALAALALRGDVLTPKTAVTIITQARTEGRPLASILTRLVPEAPLLAAIADELSLPFVDLYARDSEYKVDEAVVRQADLDQLKDRGALPVVTRDGRVVVAMANPLADQDMVDYLRSRYPEMVVALGSAHQIQSKLVYFDTTDLSELTPLAEAPAGAFNVGNAPVQVVDNPVVEWVDGLLARAAAENASDVHFRFNADGSLDVRFRVDGLLRKQAVPAPLRRREGEIIGTLLAKCQTIDPSDRSRPQDGTFTFLAAGSRMLDARLAMLPQAHGSTVVIRLLDPRNINRRVDEMGFSPQTVTMMRTATTKPQGLVLLVGPTGSGKTTTLYGMLNELDRDRLNILTVEDPIEYRMPGIGQTQIRGDLKDKSLTFAKALRAILRLDPDVVLVGEIRDRETAEVAMHAALTGHLVLSTLHTNSAMGVISRLHDLGVEPFAVSEALSLAVSQRLVRRVHECAKAGPPTPAETAFLTRVGLPVPEQVVHITDGGCSGCSGTGYRGRIPVVEVLAPSSDLRNLIAKNADHATLLSTAQASSGYAAIVADAYRHVIEGSTTVSELLRCLDAGGE